MKTATMICTALLCWHVSQAQPPADAPSFAALRTAAGPPHLHTYRYQGPPVRGLNRVAVGAFLFYKNYVSSQDGQSCSFSPSCSEYSVEAIRTQGLLRGYAASFDRLTRCHGFSRRHYAHDPQTGLALDPVR